MAEQQINFYLNNELINPPFNWRELAIDLNFDKDNPTSEVNINNWRFVIENSGIINQWIEDGLIGGPGVFEGIPFKIEVNKGADTSVIFDGFIDLTDGPRLSCEDVTVTAKEKQKIDWLNDVADSFTFEYLFEEVKSITSNDFDFVPYVINSVPDAKEAAIATVSAFVIAKELTTAIKDLSSLLTESANPFEATALIRAALYIVYLIALIATLIKLLKDIINLVIQPVKYHACMSVKTQLEKGAEYLGLTFKSTIFEGDYKDLTIIPQKQYNPTSKDDDRLLGFLSPNKIEQRGYFKGTYGDLLRAVKTMFNGKIIINDNKELIFERRDYNPSAQNYTLPSIEQPFYTLNANEFKSNYLVEFQTDLIEKNTIQDYKGTVYQVLFQPVTVQNVDYKIFKGLESVNIPFALAKRKTALTVPEKIINFFVKGIGAILNGLVKAVNAIINIFNKAIKFFNKIIKALATIGIKINLQFSSIKPLPPSDFGSTISDRIGMLKLETDFINVPKIFLLNRASDPKKNKISTQNETLVTAKYIYNNFWYIDSFKPSTEKPNGNQYIIKEFENVPFCYNDYLLVKDNNLIKDSDGNIGFLESLNWNIWEEKANFRFRINKLYTNNLTQLIYEPDGR